MRFLCLFTLLAALFTITVTPSIRAATIAPTTAAASSDPSLVGYWPFDLGSADADLSGNGNTVTAADGLGLTSDAAPTPFANQTALLSSLSANSYATAPGNHINDLQQFTISFWLKMHSLPLDKTMRLVSITNKTFVQYAPLGSHAYFEFSIQSSNQGRSIFFQDIPLNTYVHMAVTYDGNGMRAYVNGQLKNELPGFLSPVAGSGVGFSSPTAPLDGLLDDVRIYNRGLSQGEIASMSYQCSAVSEIPQAECQALLDLYKSAGGPLWTNQTNWLLNTTPCSWYGVLCANGHVYAISLPNNGLHGPLPPTWSNLSSLIVLSLYTNQLSGSIPPELGNLPNLQTLDLFNNQLSGAIPSQLGSLGKLQTLRLYNNQLRGAIPSQLANLTSLITLDLGYNALYASDSALTQFLSARQANWAATQTVPPSNLQVRALSATSASIIWATIPYTADGGFYEVFTAPPLGEAYTSAGKTADKTASSFTLTGLTTGQAYSVIVRSFTPKHGAQQNDLTSDDSASLTVTPAATTPTPSTGATITVVLDVQPDSKTNFSFGGSLGSFLLDDITPGDGDAYSNSKTFTVAAGTYNITESVPTGWVNANISCNPPADTVADLIKNQITINAANGANITCTFTTQRAGTIVAGAYNDHNHNHKQDRGDEWLGGWEMQLHTGTSPVVASQFTDKTGRATFTNLHPGSYTICETLQSGWFNITPGGNPPCYTVTVAPGTAVWTRFGNSATPLVSVTDTVPITDIIVCNLMPTDDLGNPTSEEFDPWEAEEDAAAKLTIFLPIVRR